MDGAEWLDLDLPFHYDNGETSLDLVRFEDYFYLASDGCTWSWFYAVGKDEVVVYSNSAGGEFSGACYGTYTSLDSNPV